MISNKSSDIAFKSGALNFYGPTNPNEAVFLDEEYFSLVCCYCTKHANNKMTNRFPHVLVCFFFLASTKLYCPVFRLNWFFFFEWTIIEKIWKTITQGNSILFAFWLTKWTNVYLTICQHSKHCILYTEAFFKWYRLLDIYTEHD